MKKRNIPHYSGLKDMTGRKIYDGDIVEDPHDGEQYVAEFHTGSFRLFDDMRMSHQYLYDLLPDLKIVSRRSRKH